jgi:transposase
MAVSCRGPVSAPRENLIMAMGYRPVDRDQMFLLPPDMREWLPARHFVWFLLAVLDELDVSPFEASRRLGSVGRQGYDPRMLLALLIYAYATGQRSSRRIEDLCVTDVAFRVICAQDVPDHSTIARFRKENREALAALFVQVLELAGESGLGRVGVVAVDGTRIAANASYGANRRRSWLRDQVDQMLGEADRVDAEEDVLFGEDNPSQVAAPWSDPSTRVERIRAALARTEQAAAQAAQAEERRVAARRARVEESVERVAQQRGAAAARWEDYQRRRAEADKQGSPPPTGRPPAPPEQAGGTRRALARLAADQARLADAEAAAAQALSDPAANLTDPDSGWMPTGKGWIQGYNTQLAVSDDQIVLAVKVTNATVDVAQFEPMMTAAMQAADTLNRGRARVGSPPEPVELLLADAGYCSRHNLSVPGPDRLIGTAKRERLETASRTDSDAKAAEETDPIQAMKARLATPEGISAYRRRGVTVEPVNGHLKDRHGLRQFSCRGIKAAQAEAELAAATANLLKIWRCRN